MTSPERPLPAAGSVPLIWGNVPQRNKNFTGREDILDRLQQGVASAVAAVLAHALQGFGGVGKTAVAIEYAHRFRSDYELVWWIPADDPVLVPSSLAALAEPLGLQTAMAAGIEGAAAAVLDALRRGEPYRRWLLIFDNADQPEDLNEIIPRGPGDVLITSRNHRWQSAVETSLAGLEARLGRDHHYSLILATNLASDLAALDQPAAARALGEDTLGRLRSLMGDDYPLTLGCAANLSVDLRADGAVEEADRLAEDTRARYAATLGAGHPDAEAAAEGRRLDFDIDPPFI